MKPKCDPKGIVKEKNMDEEKKMRRHKIMKRRRMRTRMKIKQIISLYQFVLKMKSRRIRLMQRGWRERKIMRRTRVMRMKSPRLKRILRKKMRLH